MVALRDRQHLGDALDLLAGALESLELVLPDLAADRDRLAGTIRSYLIPRVDDPSTPLTVVFAGPTGSGKSTLINSVVGSDVTSVGVLRPTTRAPLAVASHERADVYDRVGEVECHVVTGGAPILERMTLVDTPDIDSTSAEHRAMAETLIDNADVVVFVTSALRYADSVPWQVLRRAVARGTEVVQVLNRVGSATSGAAVDFRARLRGEGMRDALVTVPEYHLQSGDQSLPVLAVKVLRNRLADIALARDEAAESTFDRVLAAIIVQARDLTGAIEEASAAADDLEARLSVDLASRISGLSLVGVTDGLYSPGPARESRGGLRRWRRDNRYEEGHEVAAVATLVEKACSRIESDLRDWMADERSRLGISGDFSVRELRPLIHQAMEGWTDYVRRMGADFEDNDRWLITATLLEASSQGGVTRATELLLDNEAETLVARAERELWKRLEVVYEQASHHIAGVALPGRNELDESNLRSALGAVNVAAAPVYA